MIRVTTLSELCEKHHRKLPSSNQGEAIAFEIDAEQLHSARQVQTIDDLRVEFAAKGLDVEDYRCYDNDPNICALGMIAGGAPVVRFRHVFKDFKRGHFPAMGDFVLGVRAPGRSFRYCGQEATDYHRCCVLLRVWHTTFNEFEPISGSGDIEVEFAFLEFELHRNIGSGCGVVLSREMGDEWYLDAMGPMQLPSKFGHAIKGDSS